MQRLKFLILFFIFSFINPPNIYGQNLTLTIEAENSTENSVIDSLSYQKSFSNYNTLNHEIDQLHLKLQRIGYLENQIKSIRKKNDTAYISIFNLKKKYYTIYIYYENNVVPKSFLETLVKEVSDNYFILPISESEYVLDKINLQIAQEGLPFTSLKLDDFKKKDKNNLYATLIVDTNSKRTIDNIVVKGYESFPKSFLKYFLKLTPNEILDLVALKEKTQALNALSFANQIRSPELLFTIDSSSVYLYLEKRKSNSFDGFLGFGTNEATNKIEFDGYLDLHLENNLDYGETFQLQYKSDESSQKSFKADLTLPYLFGLPIGSELSLSIFKKDSTFTTVNQSASLFYQINQKQRVFLGIAVTQSNNLLKEINQQQNIEDYSATFYNVKYQYSENDYNSLLFSTNFHFDAEMGFGNRSSDSTRETQIIFNTNTFKIFRLNTKNSFYLRLKSQGILSDNYFSNELLRLGGINSIRGFEENSLLSSLYGLMNTEYRYSLSPSVYIHSIFDAAYLENNLNKTKEKLFGFGFGFGLLTKAGLFKLNYANGKIENQKIQLSNSKIHISLSTKF